MALPKNSKVIVVDDDVLEAMPLIEALSLQGLGSVYFSGDDSKLPAQPFSDVRIVFLDLELADTKAANAKAKAGKAASVIERLVARGTKYILVAWSKHADVIADLTTNLNTAGLNPVIGIIDLEKSECFTLEGERKEFNFAVIQAKITEKLQNLGMLKFFIAWENLIAESSSKIFNDFTSLLPADPQWDTEMSKVMFELAKSYAGKQLNTTDINSISRNALLTFNDIFLETIEKKIKANDFTTTGIQVTAGGTSLDVKAEINTRLLIYSNSGEVVPGNVYLRNMTAPEFRAELLNYVNSGHEDSFVTAGARPVYIEISPACDYAQGKWEVHRVLEGILCPASVDAQIKKGESLFMSNPPLWFRWDNHTYRLVFNKRRLVSREKPSMVGETPIFTVNKAYLNDIQHSIAGHISRPGTISLS